MWRQLLRLWSSPRVVMRRVLALDDTPHAVALGAAIGMLFGLTPTVGLQTIEVIVFAFFTRRLFYFNRPAALLLIYISNPLTIAPIYYALYWVGSQFVPGQATLEQFRQILSFEGFAGWWLALRQLATDVGEPLAIGTLVVAPVSAVATYPMTRFLLRWYRGDDPPTTSESTAKIIEAEQPAGDGETNAVEATSRVQLSHEPLGLGRQPCLRTPAAG